MTDLVKIGQYFSISLRDLHSTRVMVGSVGMPCVHITLDLRCKVHMNVELELEGHVFGEALEAYA